MPYRAFYFVITKARISLWTLGYQDTDGVAGGGGGGILQLSDTGSVSYWLGMLPSNAGLTSLSWKPCFYPLLRPL